MGGQDFIEGEGDLSEFMGNTNIHGEGKKQAWGHKGK